MRHSSLDLFQRPQLIANLDENKESYDNSLAASNSKKERYKNDVGSVELKGTLITAVEATSWVSVTTATAATVAAALFFLSLRAPSNHDPCGREYAQYLGLQNGIDFWDRAAHESCLSAHQRDDDNFTEREAAQRNDGKK